jgi:precorrin-4/cobalt-precorrin-4 C11-methyltransferase
LRGTLGDIEARVSGAAIERTAVIFIGRSVGAHAFGESYLYSAGRDRT